MTSLRRLWSEEQGQSWTLALTFVALACVLVFVAAGGDFEGLWRPSNIQLLAATSSAG